MIWKPTPEQSRRYTEQSRTRPDYYQRKIFNERRRFARNSGLVFDLTLDELPEIPDTCPILGIKLFRDPTKKNNPNSPSLDRLIPELGYTKSNIAWISYRANRIKSDATIEELQAVIRWYEQRVFTSRTLPRMRK